MRDDGDPRQEDEVSARLTGLANRLSVELVGTATIQRSQLSSIDGIGWDLQPVNPRSVPVSWLLFGDEILLQAGKLYRGGRWELDRSVEDVQFIERVVRAAVEVRVTETSALARSRVEVTLEDGQVVHETGYEGCQAVLVPLPGWRRWGQRTHYEPYAIPSR